MLFLFLPLRPQHLAFTFLSCCKTTIMAFFWTFVIICCSLPWLCDWAFVFLLQNVIISPIAYARLPLTGTYRKCCDRGPMTGKEIKLLCEYINAFPSIKTLSAELKIVLFWRKLDPIDFFSCDLDLQWECVCFFCWTLRKHTNTEVIVS